MPSCVSIKTHTKSALDKKERNLSHHIMRLKLLFFNLVMSATIWVVTRKGEKGEVRAL
jgi:hypothetical protein